MMMSVWNLAWIVPVSIFVGAILGMLLFALVTANCDRK